MTFPAIALTAISGGINRLRTKGGADKNSLFDLLNGYVTQAGTVKVREGTYRSANIAAYSSAGITKGLLAYQNKLHVFSHVVSGVPPGYELHVLNHPAASQTNTSQSVITPGVFAAATRIGSNTNYGLVSGAAGFAVAAIVNPIPGADVGSANPSTVVGLTVRGFFQTLASSPNDPSQVYIVLSGVAPSGFVMQYTSITGAGVSVPLVAGIITTNLGLGAGYTVYALGTIPPDFDISFANVSLLLHMDGTNGSTTIVDSSANHFVNTAHGTAALTTTSPKFGTASLNGGGGATDYVSTPVVANGPLDLSTGDFTVEFWINPNVSHAYAQPLLASSDHSTLGWEIHLSTMNIGVTFGTLFINSTAVTVGAWSAVAFVRKGTSFGLFLNGVSAAASTLAGSIGMQSPLQIRADPPYTGAGFDGGIDEVRITKGVARYTPGVNYTPAGPFGNASVIGISVSQTASIPIKEIHFSAPYLGGIYVAAQFDVQDATVLAQYGDTFHFWIQSSSGGDNSNAWQANTNYTIGNVVIPTTPNGLTYIASRRNPANPVWQSNISEAVNNIIEPTVANGFKYTATATLGTNPTTGLTEPTWPTSDGATVNENSSIASDQTVLRAVPAPTTPPTTPPTRYNGGIAGGFTGKS